MYVPLRIQIDLLQMMSFLICDILLSFRGMGQVEASREIYIKPWCRIGPYVVGFLAGYILYRTKCKIRIPKVQLYFVFAAYSYRLVTSDVRESSTVMISRN